MKQKVIALVDGNNFFVSCEVLRNPALKGRPVCVLSNNDGCVIARSNEAKKLGIAMGMPHFMAKKSFQGVTYLSSDFSLYHELSMRMMQLLKNYSDRVDVYSIDEAFLDLTGLDKIFNLSYLELAQKIKNDIETRIGLSVSAGISYSKTLAKLAVHKAKSRNGFYVIEKHLIEKEIENVPIEEVWGIGKNIARSLRKYGIFYAHEILLKDDIFYKNYYGKKGLEIKYELAGKSVIPLIGTEEKPKSIQRTRSFPAFSKDEKYITAELEMHLHNVCKKLREYNLKTSLISVMLRTKDFRVFFREDKLDFKTNSELILINRVKNLFNSMFNEDLIYRSSGVFAGSLSDTKKVQMSLFREKKQEKGENILFIIDKIEDKYGKGVISLGQTGLKSVQEAHKREMKFRSLLNFK